MLKFQGRDRNPFYWDFLIQYQVPDPVEPNLTYTCWTIITQATAVRNGINLRVTGMQRWAEAMNRDTGYRVEIKTYGVSGIFDHLRDSNPGFFENGEMFPLNMGPFL